MVAIKLADWLSRAKEHPTCIGCKYAVVSGDYGRYQHRICGLNVFPGEVAVWMSSRESQVYEEGWVNKDMGSENCCQSFEPKYTPGGLESA